jgi:uncharacterized protein (DUF362 family)/Pyruvate/2-oxoacid:ferredoxin oxidoreductase delta subunit
MKFFYVIAAIATALLVALPLLLLQGQSDADVAGLTIAWRDDGTPVTKARPVVRWDSFSATLRSIDPVTCGDVLSSRIQSNIFEGLYTYHYLKRPPVVIPLLAADLPEKCVTTHPSVFKAVAETFLETGARLRYGDSPAMGNMSGVSKKSGLMAVAEGLGVAPADFKTGETVSFKEGKQNQKFVIAKGVLESDGVISLPKLKTHSLTRMTGCVKNQFGCIPGVLKGEFHLKLPDANNFARMLIDLNQLVSPRLYIMDGIQAMAGNGPRGGTPFSMNLILVSQDPIALDATVCRLIGLKPEYCPTIKYGMAWGAGTFLEAEIELVGDDVEGFRQPDFDVTRKPVRPYRQGGITRFFTNRVIPKPRILEEKCARCGLCVNICPARPKAVNWAGGNKSKPPVYDYSACIRCYCCQEICSEGAIELKVPLGKKLIDAISYRPASPDP